MPTLNSSPMLGLLDIGNVPKDRTNEFHGYQYASEAAITARFREAMKANGLSVKSCEIVSSELGEIQTRNGVMGSCTVIVRFFFEDREGKAYGPFEGIGSGADNGDKAPMKALAAARKYAISQAALISWADDPEADTRTDLATQGRPKSNGKPNGKPKPSEPSLVPDKPEQADLFLGLLTEKAKVSTEALERAWAYDSHDPDVARACRRFAASIDDGKWWSKLKEKAAKVDAKNKAATNGGARTK